MRRERMTRIGVCVLLLGTVALTGCRLAEHGRRAAIDAFASFVLGSVLQAQKAAPLTQARVDFHGGQALLPVPSASKATAKDRQECLSSIEITLPAPQPRIAAIDLKPAATVELCRYDLARAKVAARMALAEVRGTRVRVIVIADPAAAL
jgi:hypothetical protein